MDFLSIQGIKWCFDLEPTIDAIGSAKVSVKTARKKDMGLSQKKEERISIEIGK